MTDPTTWPTVADQRPPLGAKCNYFVDGNGWSSSGTGAWREDRNIPSGCFQLDDGRCCITCNPAQTHWQLTDGPAVQSREPASVAPEATEPLWLIALTHRDAFAAELRAIAAEVERRGDLGLDLDPGETADWLRAEADRAEESNA